MRGVSLPQEPVLSLLKRQFILGWQNIIDKEYVGDSHGYTCDQAAVGTTNGAGPRNTQLFILSPDGVVMHVLPGFWHPDDLATELKFALRVYDLYRDRTLSLDKKKKLFKSMQLGQITKISPAMKSRSMWQGFDRKNEQKRLKEGPRDTFVLDKKGKAIKIKPTVQLIHERMAARPFVSYEAFDVFEFADYGRPYYDNNKKTGEIGITFDTPGRKARQERKRKERQKRRALRWGLQDPAG